jgi:hypothetical protein
MQVQMGQEMAAYASFARLNQLDGNRLEWLQGLARTATGLGKWTEAVDYWRRIAGGTPAGNNDWLEAKYNLVTCLMESQPAVARQILQQTRLLAPAMSETWTAKFAELDAKLDRLREHSAQSDR